VLDFCDLWKLDPDKAHLNKIRFRVGRNRRAWVKNCVSIGLSSCFVEPLESSGIYFIYAAIYQLVKHFPDRTFDDVLRDRFNREIETMFDQTRDFLQAHYLATPREDTAFWRANKFELRVSADIRGKLEEYDAGLTVNMPITDEATYYSNFEAELKNFWTNGSYYCILAGLGRVPKQTLPKIRYQVQRQREAAKIFARIRAQTRELSGSLPSTFETLCGLHGRDARGQLRSV
jgi:tryptophan halogenase